MSVRVFDQTILHEFLAKPSRERKAIIRHLSREEKRMLKQLVRSNRQGERRARKTVFSNVPMPWVSRRIEELVRDDAAGEAVSDHTRGVLRNMSQQINALREGDKARSVVMMPSGGGVGSPDQKAGK